ncbi:hypothetical protein KUF83_20655 [Streptomyces sp. BV286]|uniref:hypothetical protein n=1 Tax=Streptomyces sp. BV286 TaxID=2849672 RepID=UPI001C2F0D3B|nr:hypothetical protein [Streptomyces sp. BV286]MBV1938947.1 hypothetical protein [Streptomyces sp. BV286]
MTDPHQRLRYALDALDTAFAPLVDQPFAAGGCGHCYPEDDLAVLAGPPHLVPEDLVASVAARSAGHWDDFPTLYRRLTPRIVRLLVTGRLHVDHGLVASRLVAARWRDWPGPEREALEEVWRGWWRATLHEYPGPVTDVLETVAVSGGTLGPWLTVWADTRTESADRHLRDAVDGWLFEEQLADLRLGFYTELPASPELLPWLLSLEAGRLGAARLGEVERIAHR